MPNYQHKLKYTITIVVYLMRQLFWLAVNLLFMLRLSKKVEYSLLALQLLARNGDKKLSAKEISEILNVSFEFLSKVLQTLMKKGIVASYQGIRGGYVLQKPADEISIADVIHALDDTPAVVECLTDDENCSCERTDNCTIRVPMQKIQQEIDILFSKTSIAELANNYEITKKE